MARLAKASKSKIAQGELFSMVQKRAYELYEKRGRAHGDDWADWNEAERQIKKEYSLK